MLLKTTNECSNFCLFHGENRGGKRGNSHRRRNESLHCSFPLQQEVHEGDRVRLRFERPVWFSRIHSWGFARTESPSAECEVQRFSQDELLFIRKWKVFKVFTPEREEADKKTGQQGERKALEHRKGSTELFKLGVSNILFLNDLFGHRVNPVRCCKVKSAT